MSLVVMLEICCSFWSKEKFGLINMLTIGRANCIVFSEDDLPLEGLDHTRPLHISVGCLGRRVPYVLLDNGSALNFCPLATTIALKYGPIDFELDA